MQLVKKLLGLDERVDAISLRVRPITHGGFGVYANVVLIAIHDAQSEADAHCQRLLHQQSQE